MQPIILPYKTASASARALAKALDTRRVYPNRRYRQRPNHILVNWGFGGAIEVPHDNTRLLNQPEAVVNASNKIDCLETLNSSDIRVPSFATDIGGAQALILGGHEKIFCRTLTRANSGRGIVIAENVNDLVAAPLYTADAGARREYRVHVFNGEVIDFIQKKKLTTEQLEEREVAYNKDIRSHDNGWIFARDGVDLPDSVRDVAVRAVAALGLDFAAVDCYLTSQRHPTNPQVAGIFEVNTAPGLEGTTLERYVEAIRNYCDA